MTSEGEVRVHRRSRLWGGGAVLLLLLLLAVPIVLHFMQRMHDQLRLDFEASLAGGDERVPGEVFAGTLAAIVEHELDAPFGWRPNDIVVWGPGIWADNNSNRQLGIIQTVRETTRVLRDNLTKVSATEYDQNLVDADTKLRNDEYKLWFPSAENRFGEGAAALRRYVEGLTSSPQTSKPMNRRNVELIRLFQTWTDLLGSAHANLYAQDVSFFETDDQFYHAQGMAHVMAHIARAIELEYGPELRERATVLQLLEQVERSLSRAATLKPLIVLDSSPDGLFANHRRNLDVFIVDGRQLMYSIRDELEK